MGLKSVFQPDRRDHAAVSLDIQRFLSTESYAGHGITGQLASENRNVQKNSTSLADHCRPVGWRRDTAGIRRQGALKKQLCTARGGHVHGEDSGRRLRFSAEKIGRVLARVHAPGTAALRAAEPGCTWCGHATHAVSHSGGPFCEGRRRLPDRARLRAWPG